MWGLFGSEQTLKFGLNLAVFWLSIPFLKYFLVLEQFLNFVLPHRRLSIAQASLALHSPQVRLSFGLDSNIFWFRAALASLTFSFAFGKGCNTERLRRSWESQQAAPTQRWQCTFSAATQFRTAHSAPLTSYLTTLSI
jgi:hypothetical protein